MKEKPDAIANYFKGKFRTLIEFKRSSDGKDEVRERVVENFAAIMVRVVGFNELYSAWETQVEGVIDDYKEDENAQPKVAH